MDPRELEEANGTEYLGRGEQEAKNVVREGYMPVDESQARRRWTRNRSVERPDGSENGQVVVVSNRQDHKDSLNRYLKVKETVRDKDHYLNPYDGKLVLLRVQSAAGYVRNQSIVTTWSNPRKPNPFTRGWNAVQESPQLILSWAYSDWLRHKSATDRSLPDSMTRYNPNEIYWKYPVASLLLVFTAFLGSFEGTVYPGGRYLPVRYTNFSYMKTPRNRKEADPTQRWAGKEGLAPGHNGARESIPPYDTVSDGVLVFKRHLRPRKLCVILDSEGNSESAPVQVQVVDSIEWDDNNPNSEKGEYVFVSYTRAQFHTYSPDDKLDWAPPTTEEGIMIRHFEDANWQADRQQLLEIGIQAARDAGVKAFWIDIFCMPDAEVRKMDSHRICDVTRGAKSMVIAIQDTVRNRALRQPSQTMDDLLQSWSSRLWTLPEMLLAPTRHDFKIYLVVGNSVQLYDIIPKRSMAARAYRGQDAMLVRQLVDHFEGSQQLTLTELLAIGLECLVNRDTNPFMPADQVYALMTMVRRRPVPNPQDSLFEAFAKLSLLNDSNSLLERLICTLPRCRGEPWHKLEDFWGVKLWDIEPTVQVSAIAADQTVVLDGAFGASIEWEELARVGFLKRKTVWRSIASLIVQLAPGWLLIAIITLVTVGSYPPVPNYHSSSFGSYGSYDTEYMTNPLVGIAAAFFVIAIIAVAALPYTLLSLYSGKFWSTQALLIGLEGHADLDWLERQLFGFSQGRLRWSTSGTTQSIHQSKPTSNGLKYIDDEVEALEPSDAPLEYAAHLHTKPDADRVFTIVDTYSMTVMLIRAVHPPTVALVCGQEGGMRRVLLCSYDYNKQTFHRETVVRMPTKVLDRMDRVDKFRFSMANMPLPPDLPPRKEMN